MRVVSYIRVSSKGQLDGDGPERQRAAIRTFTSQQGLSHTQEFFEQGVSGTTDAMAREAFSEMIEFIDQQDDVEAVVVERLDRLARDLMVSEFLMRELRKRGVQLFATDHGLVDVASDEGDPTRKLIRQIMGALAEWEKSQLVAKMRTARQRLKAAGKRVEGAKPYGRNAPERTLLDMMKRWRRDDGWSHGRIANVLNAGDFRTRSGSVWSRQAVRDILHNQGIK